MSEPTTAVSTLVRANAYTGTAAATGSFASDRTPWALQRDRYETPTMRPAPIDLSDWADPSVGWGLVLPERSGLSAKALATADDAPEPIRQLLKARSGKVLRYRRGSTYANWTLRDYGGSSDMQIAVSNMGTGPGQLPKYLLIYAPPSEVPWSVQYALNPVRFVGRLDLDGEALANYVAASITGWTDAACDYTQPVVWAVDHGGGDITATMRNAVAEPVFREFEGDGQMTGAEFIDGSAASATGAALEDALAAKRPAIVVTSSHGMTGPLNDSAALRDNLGLPVDGDHRIISPARLLESWQPDGAIWFAQACCSAGSDAQSGYAGLFAQGSLLAETLSSIATCAGSAVSPLPRALLGAKKPLRAFIGHVEPTFDWTLEFPPNDQVLTPDLTRALYHGIADGQPVGLAMSWYYPAIGSLLTSYESARYAYNDTVGGDPAAALDMLVYARVTARDRASTVILGDPAAALAVPAEPSR